MAIIKILSTAPDHPTNIFKLDEAFCVKRVCVGFLFQDIPEAPERQMTDKINKVLYFTRHCPVTYLSTLDMVSLNSSQMFQYPLLPYVAVVNSYKLLFQFHLFNKGVKLMYVAYDMETNNFSTHKSF